MANPEHVEIVKQGAVVLGQWRDHNPDRQLDLSHANLNGAILPRVNLANANLTGMQCIEGNLSHSLLWDCDLTFADLSLANLERASLRYSNLEHSKLIESQLLRCDLLGADLIECRLFNAVLHKADLRGSNFTDADLSNGNLTGSFLHSAVFTRSILKGCNFAGATVARTTFAALDLSTVGGLTEIDHVGPSYLDFETLLRSNGEIPGAFLRGCGVPQDLLTYLPSLLGRPLDFYTCFISYAEPDARFSERLYNDLQAKGIRCWRWREDAKWGETLLGEIDAAIRVYDKLIVICSEGAFRSEPMIREIERALQKEQREGKTVLFPIRLDDHVFEWKHELQADVVRKNVGDFRNWTDPVAYDKALTRLIRDLKAKPAAGEKP